MQSFKDTEIIKMASGIIRVFNINYNSFTKHSSHQYLVRIAVFLSDNEQIFILLFEIMICQVCWPSGTLQRWKIVLKFGKLSRSFHIFVCLLGEKFLIFASHSCSRPTRFWTIEEYEHCLLNEMEVIDHTFYGFTGVITQAGCWENTRKADLTDFSWLFHLKS